MPAQLRGREIVCLVAHRNTVGRQNIFREGPEEDGIKRDTGEKIPSISVSNVFNESLRRLRADTLLRDLSIVVKADGFASADA